MKTCPNCGSTLADNEPYCENCGFNPGFDSGSWNYGQRKSARKFYNQGKPVKNQEPSAGESFGTIILIIAIAALIFGIFLPFYNNDNIIVMIIFLTVFVIVSSACMLS